MPVIYKLDPRTKIAVVLLLSVLVFIVNKLPAAACLLFSLLAFRAAGRIPFKGFKSLSILSMLAVFVIVFQTLFGPGENYIVKPLFPPSFPVLGGSGSLKWDDLFLGLAITCRLAALMLLIPMLTQTTSYEEIAMGLCAFGFNYRIAFIITTAFNMVPVFEEEGRAIIDAQKLRGMRSFEEGTLFKKLKAYPALVVPLVLGAMRKAQSASVAMDSRAFGVYRTRTWLEKPVMKIRDYLFLAACLVFIAFVLTLDFLL
jgi:energy-coupling factor transport system permease protein